MALINKLTNIAEKIRGKTGDAEKLTLEEMASIIEEALEKIEQTYVLVDENGNEFQAVLVDNETIFDATANDIREGKVAVTEEGVTVGTKVIPSYHTYQGVKIIQPGKAFEIKLEKVDAYDYTKLQAIFCDFNSSLSNSVSSTKVAIENKVYEVLSVNSISDIIKNATNKTIEFGIINETDSLKILRYFTYKEVN